jgi:peptide/nickel transport system permease protein
VLPFVLRRLVQAVPLLLLISLLVFALIHAAPGGPLSLYLSNPNVRPEDIERLRHALGLDLPSLIVLPIDYSIDVAITEELGQETVAT